MPVSRLILSLFLCASLTQADQIVTVDATAFDDIATIVRGAQGLVVTTVSGEIYEGEVLRRVVFHAKYNLPLNGPYLFGMANGDRLAGNLVANEDDLKLRIDGVGHLTVPFFDLRAFIVIEAMTEDPLLVLTQIEGQSKRNSDQIVLRSKTAYDNVFVDSISPDRVQFELDDEEESISLAQIQSIQIAELQPPEIKQGPTRVRVTLLDGIRFSGDLVSYVGGKLTLADVYGARVVVDNNNLRQIEFRNDKVRHLSDLRADDVVHEQALIALPFPPRYNLNCMNPPGPLQLDGQTYDSGIGMHTYTRMSFDISELGAERLRGLVGLNDRARDAALSHPDFPSPAKVQIYLDGKPWFEEALELNLEDRVTRFDVPLTGVSKLELEADFNKTYDMLGRVDWADVYLIRAD